MSRSTLGVIQCAALLGALSGCYHPRRASVSTVGRVERVTISSASGFVVLARPGATVATDRSCVAFRVAGALEAVRGDTLLLDAVTVLPTAGAMNRCNAARVAVVQEEGAALQLVVLEPRLGRTFLGGGLAISIGLMILLAATWN